MKKLTQTQKEFLLSLFLFIILILSFIFSKIDAQNNNLWYYETTTGTSDFYVDSIGYWETILELSNENNVFTLYTKTDKKLSMELSGDTIKVYGDAELDDGAEIFFEFLENNWDNFCDDEDFEYEY